MNTPTITRKDFDALFRKYRNMVRGIVYEYEKDPDRVPELVNDVFLRAWEKRDKFNGDSEPSTWLHTVAHNVCVNYLRDEVDRQPELLSEWAVGDETDGLQGESWLEQNAVDAADPESILIAQERIREGVDQLSEVEREVYETMYTLDYSATATADLLGMSRNAVDQAVHRIKQKIL